MKIKFIMLCACSLVVCAALSAEDSVGDSAEDHERESSLEDLYFSKETVHLTAKEMNALTIAKAWQQGDIMTENPVVGPDGSIEFLFGAEQPSVVCAVMQITDIELQPGESVTSVNLGDSVRWQVQPALSAADTTHLLVRPKQTGLETSMVVTTDRRTYHIRLRSHRTDYMPRIKFFYLENAVEKWNAITMQAKKKRETATIPETKEYLGDLDFDYSISGKASWKPVRVYNDSTKTIIEMPKTARQKESPVLMITHKTGRRFRKGEMGIVNYRVQSNRYIVDSVFDRAVLVVGVGRNQEKITIARTPRKGGK